MSDDTKQMRQDPGRLGPEYNAEAAAIHAWFSRHRPSPEEMVRLGLVDGDSAADGWGLPAAQAGPDSGDTT